MTASADAISSTLLTWYDCHARDLPWRSPPGAPPPDPYHVWLSEVMLQQTTVAAVKPFFAEFLRRWPDIKMLAGAGEQAVMSAWAGLGYYARARNMIRTARIIADQYHGHFPPSEAALRNLPGVGAYTAAAIAAIAFGQRAIVVDANVERVTARLFAINTPLPAARSIIREKAGSLTPAQRAGDFAQAMMDLGAGICTARTPDCRRCPLVERCAAHAADDPAGFPVKPAKQARPRRSGHAYWIERDGQVWLVTRPARGLLGGMRALPDDAWNARTDGTGVPPITGAWHNAGTVRHVFTHFALELAVARIIAPDKPPQGEGEWWPVEQIEQAGLPTVFAKVARLAIR